MKTQFPLHRVSADAQSATGIGLRTLVSVPALIAASLIGTSIVHGADGTIYYNRVSNPSQIPTVRAIRANGTNDRPISIGLPFAANPVVSRDGSQLLVTSADPILYNQMISQNVFRVNLATGATSPISHYVDTLTNGTITYINRFDDPDFDTYSYYGSNLPNYKAFSPSGSHVAVMNLKSVSGKPPGGSWLPPTQSPWLEVFPVQQVNTLGEFLFAGAERTGLNQTGDGVDWHPTLNQLVGAVRQDIPATTNIGPGQTEGTVIKVFNATGSNPFVRNITAPVGTRFYDFVNFAYSTSTNPQDYAAAISWDGSKVAYIRNTLSSDTRIEFGAFLLTGSSLRVINYDGTGDQELLSFGPGIWITKLAWSPDGTEIAFDHAPQLISNGLRLQMADATNSEVRIVRLSDQSVRTLATAPASFPTWSPLTAEPVANQVPVVQISRTGNRVDLLLTGLVIGNLFDVESSSNLAQWTTVETFTASAATRTVSITPPAQTTKEFYRIKAR